MKAKIEALNKSYLVEFKDEDQFVSFLTQHNDKINNVEVINEESLPELQKPVEVAKPSMSDGWKTLEKSAFTQKEKGVEKKGMTLGGKYAEFKYEPDKTLDNAADSKVSTPKSDSPALTGDEPKVADVEATAKEAEVEAPKTEAPKAEEAKTEPAKEESPKAEEPKEEKSEDKEESSEEDKEEKKEDIDESVDAEINEVLEAAGIVQEDGYVANFGKLVGGKGTLNDYGAWLDYDYNANKSDELKSLKTIANNASKLKMSGDSRTDRRYDVYPVRFNHEIIDKVHELEEKARNGKEDLIYLYKQVSELFTEDFVGVFHFMKRFLGMHEQWQPNWIDESDWDKFADSCAAGCILNAGTEWYRKKNRKKIKENNIDEELNEVLEAAGVQLDEGLFDAMKSGFKKVSDVAKKAAIAGTIALAVLTGTGAAQAAEEPEYRIEQIQIIDGNGEKQTAEFKIYEDGSAIDEYGNAFSESQLEDLKQGKDPYGV